MAEIAANLQNIRDQIELACEKSGRSPGSVSLIAVSKTFPVDLIRDAVEAGQLVFGESKLQEAEAKIELLPSKLQWHFIGRIQRNKVRKLLFLFPVLHAIDSLRLAEYSSAISEELGLFPQAFLQVNIGGEASKGGFEPGELEAEMEKLLSLNRLEVQGLMTIPPVGPDQESARKWFVELRDLRDRLEEKFGVKLPGLSMGMSSDFQVAIEEGATHVRVGSAIFGGRRYRVDGELG